MNDFQISIKNISFDPLNWCKVVVNDFQISIKNIKLFLNNTYNTDVKYFFKHIIDVFHEKKIPENWDFSFCIYTGN